MYDIESFRRQYIENIRSDADAAGVSPAEEFLVAATKDMAAFDVCPEAEPCAYAGTGRHNRSVVVHGFAYTDGDGGLSDRTLSLFVCDYSGDPDPPKMTEREFNDHARRCIAFIEESMDGQIASGGPGARLAAHIREEYGNYDRVFVYVVTDRIRSSRLKEVKDRDLGGKTLFFRLIDMEYIADTLKSSRPDDDSVIRVSDFGYSAIPCVKAGSSETCTSYIGAVPGMFLALIYRDYGSRLLESNVRSFLTGKTKVNKGIRDTIRESPDMFFAYNNGVALTASEVEIGEHGITSFTNLQIVNGGQTTVSLFKALKTTHKENLSEVFVPMKLVVVPSEDAFDVVRSISVFVNTQNAVRESDLTSSSRFQMAMEEASRRCAVPGSGLKWYYERARGQFEQDSAKGGDPEFKKAYDRRRKLDKIDFAKYRCMLELKPDVVSKGGQTCYGLFSREVSKAFSENPSAFGDEYFKEAVTASMLYDAVYDAVGGKDWFDGYLRPQISCYAVSKTVSDLAKAGRVLGFEEAWRSQAVPSPVVEHAVAAAESFSDYLKEISEAGGNVAQECRRRSCWESFSQIPAEIPKDMEACCPAAGAAKTSGPASKGVDESVYALRAFDDWRKVKLLMMRESADRKEVAVIEDVMDYLKNPSAGRISPSRAKQALEIRRRYVRSYPCHQRPVGERMRPQRGLLGDRHAVEAASEERLRPDAFQRAREGGGGQPAAFAERPFPYGPQAVREADGLQRAASEEGVSSDLPHRVRDDYPAQARVAVERPAPDSSYHAPCPADLHRLRDPDLFRRSGVSPDDGLPASALFEKESGIDRLRGLRPLFRPQVLRQHGHGALVQPGIVAYSGYHRLQGRVLGIRHEHGQLPRTERGHVFHHGCVGGRHSGEDHPIPVGGLPVFDQRAQGQPRILGVLLYGERRKP